jgi:predicted MarR family transcription regulator
MTAKIKKKTKAEIIREQQYGREYAAKIAARTGVLCARFKKVTLPKLKSLEKSGHD